MRGRSIRQGIAQRAVIDLMRFAVGRPVYTDGKRMDLSRLAAARSRCADRPRWLAIFVKACAIVAQDIPQLRRVYLPYPWPRVFEYPTSAAMIFVRRDHADEAIHFAFIIKNPAALSLAEIDRRITDAATQPMEKVRPYRNLVRLSRLPSPFRRLLLWFAYNIGRQRPEFFGTYGVTYPPPGRVAGWLSVWTARYSYGPIATDGHSDVRLTIDHRVVDGDSCALAVTRLEQVLNGPVADELMALADSAGRAPPSER